MTRVRVCFSQSRQRLLDFLSRGVSALDVPDHLPPQQREPFGAINVPVFRSFKVEGRDHHGRRFQKLSSRIIRESAFRSVVRPVGLILHIATRTDRRFRLVRKRLAAKRNVGERRSDRLDSCSGLSGGHTPGEQRRRHLGELRFYTQEPLPRDLLQQFISTTGGAALAFRFANSGTMSVRGIDPHQAVCGLDQTPLRAYPAVQRDILGQHFFRAFNRKLGPVDALPGIGNFIGRHRASVVFRGVHHEFPTHGGRYRSLMSGETGAAA